MISPAIAFSTEWLGDLEESTDPQHPGPLLPDEGDDEWWFYDLITKYCQPATTVAQSAVVDKAVAVWRGGYDDNIVQPCIFRVAEQIPYSHPAHRTLAELVVAIDDAIRAKRSAAGQTADTDIRQFIILMGHRIYDIHDNPVGRKQDGKDPRGFLNSWTWLAHIMNLGNRLHAEWEISVGIIEALYEDEDVHKQDLEMRSLWIVGVAQWFMPDVIDAAWLAWLSPLERAAVMPSLLWSDWAAKFREAAARGDHYTQECRDIATKAATTIDQKIKASGDPGDSAIRLAAKGSGKATATKAKSMAEESKGEVPRNEEGMTSYYGWFKRQLPSWVAAWL